MYGKKTILYNGYKTPQLFKSTGIINVDGFSTMYTMKTTMSAQSLSMLLYNSREYDWLLYRLNNVIHPVHDWIMSNDVLLGYCTGKYDNIEHPHHFYHTTTGDTLTDNTERDAQYAYENGTLPSYIKFVSNYEYEKTINDKKSVVKIIPPNTITKFMVYYNKQVNAGA